LFSTGHLPSSHFLHALWQLVQAFFTCLRFERAADEAVVDALNVNICMGIVDNEGSAAAEFGREPPLLVPGRWSESSSGGGECLLIYLLCALEVGVGGESGILADFI
jgi:hypothetical protein